MLTDKHHGGAGPRLVEVLVEAIPPRRLQLVDCTKQAPAVSNCSTLRHVMCCMKQL